MAPFLSYRFIGLVLGFLTFTVALESYSENSTIADVARRTYGESIYNPSPESLIGQYISLTGAKTIVRRFLTAPPGSTLPPSELGAEKLVVAVSWRSWPQFRQLFSDRNYFYHVHTPRQDTLMVAFDGRVGYYGQLASELQVSTPGTLIIPILISDSEGERVAHYFGLGGANYELTLYPWYLVDDQNLAYAPVDGWVGCTFWLGNIPIGDLLVDEYVYASGEGDIDGSHPNVQKLRPYTRWTGGQLSGDLENLVRRVWKVPGHQQLADVLGLRASNLRGEFANPGWVAYTLLGAAAVDRNPIVFLFVEDERLELDPNFPTYIDAH